MLDGWYCRSMANLQANEGDGHQTNRPAPSRPSLTEQEYSSDSSSDPEPEPNYRQQYLQLKKKLKHLIYENECFQDALRSSQKRLLRVSRDRSFLLDRLMLYEKQDSSTSESEETESSDDAEYSRVDQAKSSRKRMDPNSTSKGSTQMTGKGPPAVKRKRAPPLKKKQQNASQGWGGGIAGKNAAGGGAGAGDGHMTREEVERHLQSRQSYLELLPERAPPTVPTEMFSNDPSLDSESNDVMENSPNVEEWIE